MSYGNIRLWWSVPKEPDTYNLYHSTSPFSKSELPEPVVTGLTQKTYRHLGLLQQIDHYYRVASVKDGLLYISNLLKVSKITQDILMNVFFATEDKSSSFSILDFVFIQDISGSFGDDLTTVNTLLDNLLSEILTLVPDTRFAVTTFCDIPEEPFGNPGDTTFTINQSLTSDTNLIKNAYQNIPLQNGNDSPESQLIALLSACNSSMGYRPNSKKIFLLLTDDTYHTSSDDSRYPKESEVVGALNELGVFPIFGLADSGYIPEYQALLNSLGTGLITTIGSSSANIINAVTQGLAASQKTLKFPLQGTVLNIKPNTPLNIVALDSANQTFTDNVIIGGDGSFITTTDFSGLANGVVSFTFNGINVLGYEFTFNKTVYKY